MPSELWCTVRRRDSFDEPRTGDDFETPALAVDRPPGPDSTPQTNLEETVS